MDKVALGQVFPRVFRFSPVSFIPPVLHYTEKRKKIIIFIKRLHNKPQGCGASVASAAEPFTKQKSPKYNTTCIRRHLVLETHVTRGQMIKTYAFRTYSRGAKRPPYISRLKAVHRSALSRTPQYVGIDRCYSSLKRGPKMFGSPERDCINLLLQLYPQAKKSIGVKYIGLPHPIHLPGYVMFHHCRDSSSCSVPQLCRAEDISASQLEAYLQWAPPPTPPPPFVGRTFPWNWHRVSNDQILGATLLR
jgi:hypothetical protein